MKKLIFKIRSRFGYYTEVKDRNGTKSIRLDKRKFIAVYNEVSYITVDSLKELCNLIDHPELRDTYTPPSSLKYSINYWDDDSKTFQIGCTYFGYDFAKEVLRLAS
jgi:hypothetical protein